MLLQRDEQSVVAHSLCRSSLRLPSAPLGSQQQHLRKQHSNLQSSTERQTRFTATTLTFESSDCTRPAGKPGYGAPRPGGYPSQAPGGYPGQAPGGYPGQAPGGYPGQASPGQHGQYPGQQPPPGQYPGQQQSHGQPGQYPGQQAPPGQYGGQPQMHGQPGQYGGQQQAPPGQYGGAGPAGQSAPGQYGAPPMQAQGGFGGAPQSGGMSGVIQVLLSCFLRTLQNYLDVMLALPLLTCGRASLRMHTLMQMLADTGKQALMPRHVITPVQKKLRWMIRSFMLKSLACAGAEQAAADGAGQPAGGDVPAAGAAKCVRQAGPRGLQVCLHLLMSRTVTCYLEWQD
jgi:hypothetical protein